MSYDPDFEALQFARERGYLVCQGPKPQKLRLQKVWRRECLQSGNPIVVVTKHYLFQPRLLRAMIWADLCGDWWLSRRLWLAVQTAMDVGVIDRFGNQIRLYQIPPRETLSVADKFLEVLVRHRPSPEEAFAIPDALARGPAKCLYTDGMESLLTESHTYVIREIPNMLGHVVVFRPGRAPLVGIHLDRFELVADSLRPPRDS